MARNNYSDPNNLGAPDTPGGSPSATNYPPFDISLDANEGNNSSVSFDVPKGYIVTPTLPPDDDDNYVTGPIPPTETIPGFGVTEVVTDPASKDSMHLVVGWLVCISGPCKGQDFRLHNGWNFIGRDSTLDVCLEDTAVSRQRVAKIVYDPESLTFGIAPCEGTTALSRLNGKPLRGDRDFEAHDIVKIGNSELMLIPFCSEKFAW